MVIDRSVGLLIVGFSGGIFLIKLFDDGMFPASVETGDITLNLNLIVILQFLSLLYLVHG
jgi:hypothetical protein